MDGAIREKAAQKIVLVQPWFSGEGHPAQSLLNFSRVIPKAALSLILISSFAAGSVFEGMAGKLVKIAPVRVVGSRHFGLRLNTIVAGLALARRALIGSDRRGDIPLFVDCDLIAMCLLIRLGVFKPFAKPAVVLLHGPERVAGRYFINSLVRSVLSNGACTIFLRSQAHLEAWDKYCSQARLRLLPPIEGAIDEADFPEERALDGPLRVGVIGQIRVGKCIPQLLRLQERHAGELAVTVRGPLFLKQSQEFVDLALHNPNIECGYMSEDVMMGAVMQQDYLACLFEESWDLRNESATFWLAVKALKPVVCFEHGWVADMVRATGCGIIVPSSNLSELVAKLPARSTEEYRQMSAALLRFRERVTTRAVWDQLQNLLN